MRRGPWVTVVGIPPQLSGGCELTVVIHDFLAGNSNELTVRRGQTVEVLERCHERPDWCLVRTTDRSPALEGLVPCAMLCIAHSRSSMEMEGIFNHKGRGRRHTQTHAHTYTHTHTHTDMLCIAHSRSSMETEGIFNNKGKGKTCTQTHTHTHTRTCSHTNTHKYKHTRTRRRSCKGL